MSSRWYRQSRRGFLLSIATGVIALQLPISDHAFASGAKRGGTLTLVIGSEPTNLVAAFTTDNVTKVSPKIHESLLIYDFDLKPVGALATAWSVSPDGKRYTFTLRKGVRWHDGVDFTSADVAFSIKLLKEVHPLGRSTFAAVTDIETPDPYTAVIVLERPVPYLLNALGAQYAPIVAKHIYETGDPRANPHNTAPIGTGPFKFKEFVRGSHLLLVRNEDYWDSPKPYADQLVVKFITDAAARTAAIESGEADIGGDDSIPLAELDRIKALPFIEFQTRGTVFSAGVRRIEFNLDNPYFAKLQVRQAVAHAIDKERLRDTVWYGYGDVVSGPISTELKTFYDPDLPTYPYDLALSEKLLDEAGLPRGADGVRFKVVHDFRPWTDGDKRTAEYIKQALGKIGIDVTVRTQDFATYVRRVYTDRDFDFVSNSMTNMFDPSVGVQRLYWSKNFKKGVPFSNASHYNSPEADRLLEAAAVENDPAKRRQIFDDFQKTVATDLPDINYLSSFAFSVNNKRVKDVVTDASGISGSLANAYIDG